MTRITDLKGIKSIPKEKIFALDTNVLYWTFYSKCTYSRTYQIKEYPDFIEKLINNENKIIITAANLNELFHIIEKNECSIYNKVENKNIGLKHFRKISVERQRVQSEISLIYRQLTSIPQVRIVECNICDLTINNFIDYYVVHNCDYFDFNLIEYCNKNNCAVISDDADFVNSYLKTDLYTACPHALRA